VSNIENHRHAKLSHDGERTHVNDQIIVAEACAPLGQQKLAASCGLRFFYNVSRVMRREKLSLLHIDGAARLYAGSNQIRLAAKKSRDLQYVRDFRDALYLRDFVHVRQHRHACLLFNFLQDGQALIHSRPAKAFNRGTVRFIERSLEDVIQARDTCAPLTLARHQQRMFFGFNDARPGDDRQAARPERNIANLE
jgi:hypothetical protein